MWVVKIKMNMRYLRFSQLCFRIFKSCGVTPYRLVNSYRCCKGKLCLYFEGHGLISKQTSVFRHKSVVMVEVRMLHVIVQT